MEIQDWETTKGLNELLRDIRRLDLERHVNELDTLGYTIVPPEKVAPPEFVDRLREKIFDVAEQRTGVRPSLDDGETHGGMASPVGEGQYWLVFEDRVFEEALMNEVSLTLATYLLGESCTLSVNTALLKGPGTIPLPLHTDNWGNGIPAPYPPYAQVANTTWLLSDYTKENGALCFVPGSHRWKRAPVGMEMMNFDQAVPVEAPAGSLVVWSGDMWHGAFARTNPGLRVGMLFGYGRHYVVPFQPYREKVTKEMLERNGPRFAALMGQNMFQGFEVEGPDHMKTMARPTGLYD